MENKIFEKLYQKWINNTFHDILSLYQTKGYLIINFLYFAQIVQFNLLEKNKDLEYEKILLDSDFLFPDWIALNLLHKKFYWINLPNLNWTDLIPDFLNKCKSNNINVNLFIYWWIKDYWNKIKTSIKEKFNIDVTYRQDWYSNFNLDNFEKSIPQNNWINIFLASVWKPHRSYQNKNIMKKNKMILFNVWGLLDFWCWYEKRAPIIVRNIKLEWLRRLFAKPQKNFKKVMQSFILFKYLLQKH